MGGVDEVAGFNGKVDTDERIGSVGWVLSKGITPTRSGNAGQGQEAVWIFLAHVFPRRLFATITMAQDQLLQIITFCLQRAAGPYADLGGKANYYLRDQPKPSAIPLVNLSEFISDCCLHDARFIAALLCQHSPGDPRQLVGKSCPCVMAKLLSLRLR